MTFFLILVCAGLGFALYRTRRQLQIARGRVGVRGLGVSAAESWSKVAEDLSGLRFRQRISALEEQLQQARSAQEVAQRRITALQQENENLNGRVGQKDSRIQEIADEKGSLLNENQRLRARLQELDQHRPLTVQDSQESEVIAQLQAQVGDYRIQHEQYRRNLSQLEIEKEELKAELRALQADWRSAQLSYEEQKRDLEHQLANANQQVGELNRYIAEVTQKLATQEQDYLVQISVLKEQVSQTEAQLRDTDKSRSLETRTEGLIEKDHRIQELEVYIEKLQGQVSELQRHQSVESAELETSLTLLRDHLALINDGDQTGVEEGDRTENNHAALRELASHLLDAHAQQEFFFRQRIQALESERESLNELEIINHDLESELAVARSDLMNAVALLDEIIEENEGLREDNNSLQRNLAELNQLSNDSEEFLDEPKDESYGFTSVSDALNAAKEACLTLEIWDCAIDSAHTLNDYLPNRVYKSLLILNEVGQMYFEGKVGTDLDEVFRNKGVTYSPRESEMTMSRYGYLRRFRNQGDSKYMYRHLKMGRLRIHFEFDKESKKVQVAYCGKHLPIATG
ncbi:MAG: hypothetical protein IGQ88_12610 [Gloeomargaritaceae cyanobacterium C42_A2020_066]|nr:hypothetical protein [Gloeomargaritaceae cyanobacterium C42_A2020_066]